MSQSEIANHKCGLEQVPCRVFESADDASRQLAQEVAGAIRARDEEGGNFVLGLATGSTPVKFYRELIRLHREDGLSFQNVITFNLDEYGGLDGDHPESYARFMADQLFDHVDLKPENTHIPEGNLTTSDEIMIACEKFEDKIRSAGGIDIQILGIGRTGHIGFNEPGSPRDSRTRRISLDRITREDAASDFLGIDNVPRFAVTMGVGTILEARRVVLMAWGESKADIVEEAVEGAITDRVTASFLQVHDNAEYLLDRRGAASLTRFRRPWLVGSVNWNERLQVRAVTWLCQKVGKPVLRLVDEDYNSNGMADLLVGNDRAYQLNIDIFNHIGHTISGWPGGKPGVDDSNRPVKSEPPVKKIAILAPEPQDELIGMGATIERLISQGHEVTVIYMTSGELRVADEEVEAYAKVLLETAEEGQLPGGSEAASEFAHGVLDELKSKGEFGIDTPALRALKRSIRRVSARAGIRRMGISIESLRFLDLPFYANGRYRRFNPEPQDATILAECLSTIAPDMIFVPGASADPTSHRYICYDLVRQWDASQGSDTDLWFYRVGGPAHDVGEIDMAVPLSPEELDRKINAIAEYRQHTSSTGLSGEIGQELAQTYDRVGLAEYEALESFRRAAEEG